MSGFLLSPGITPELTDVFVIELPLALAAGYLFGRRTGFEVAFALNTLALGVVKLVTDFPDIWDDIVSVSALLGGGLWLATTLRLLDGRTSLRSVCAVAGLIFVVAGLAKLTDFYDPFDLLLADAVIVSGIALWVYRHGYPGATAAPSSASS